MTGLLKWAALAALFALVAPSMVRSWSSAEQGAAQQPSKTESAPAKPASAEEQRLIQSLNGQALFRAYCASCHGVDAKGDGPAASSLKKAPPDLTRIAQRNAGQFPALRIQKIISGEDVGTSAHGSREMPVWGPIFGQIAWDQDLGKVRIYNLSKYIESLQKK
jgi:mono/diheme cytochrome c family protein